MLVASLAIAITGCTDDESKESKGADPQIAADASGTDARTPIPTGGAVALSDSATGPTIPLDSSTGTDGATATTDSATATTDAAVVPPEPADYAVDTNWLCRPGRDDSCTQDLATTIVAADGTMTREEFVADPDPPIDCFYVYPTVSLDEAPNSDLEANIEEERVVQAQFARFGEACRLFAPMYRQITLTALRAMIADPEGAPEPDRALAYGDVLDAFEYYLENDNGGRGFVLVGHSQGSGMLVRLIQDLFDKESPDPRFIAAMPIGIPVEVPKGGGDVGGTFEHVPLCRTVDQLGCVVAFSSFRSNVPPPEDSRFGRTDDANFITACTNPAALGGGRAELNAYLPTDGPGSSAAPMPAWVTPEKAVETAFVKVPGMLSAECVSNQFGSYLAIIVNGDPADARVDDIVGDVVVAGEVLTDWGLHLIDVHLTIGDLIDLVEAKAAAHAAL